VARVNLFLGRLAALAAGPDLRSMRRVGRRRRRSAVVNADDVIANFDLTSSPVVCLSGARTPRIKAGSIMPSEPAQVASFPLTAWVFAEFVGDLLEILALLHAFEQPWAFSFCLSGSAPGCSARYFLLVVGEFVLLFD